MKYSYLVLVRHGESLWNKKGLWTGWRDISLSAGGKKEALNVAKTIRHIKFDIVTTSSLKRAIKTWEIIRDALNLHHLIPIKHHALNERHYGIFTGKNKWEIKKAVGDTEFQRIRRGWDTPIPEGETLKDVFGRVIPHFQANIWPKILEGKNVLVVAHGNTNRAIIKHLENIPHEKIGEVEMNTGEVVIYKIDNQGKIIHKEKRATN